MKRKLNSFLHLVMWRLFKSRLCKIGVHYWNVRKSGCGTLLYRTCKRCEAYEIYSIHYKWNKIR